MKKFNFLLVLAVAAVILCGISGCSSAPPYHPPAPDKPQATVRFTNDCDFTLYLMIDGKDAGYIYCDEVVSFQVTPGEHHFEFTGTDTDITYDEDFPLYFVTRHTFANSEIYPMAIRFGVNF